MTQAFDFEPLLARDVLARMRRAPTEGIIALPGMNLAQGGMGALLQAEFLAAEAGLVPWSEVKPGDPGIESVGAARARIAKAPENVRTLYLATHATVRATHASAKPWGGKVPELGALGDEPIGEPISGSVIIAVTVVALAAVLGTAWYLEKRATVEVSGRNVRTMAMVADLCEVARAQLAAGKPIPAEIWGVLQELADSEREGPPWLKTAAITAAVGVGIFAAWQVAKAVTSKGHVDAT